MSGMQVSATTTTELLQVFQQFGEILDYKLGFGNWIFFKYHSPVSAEQAVLHGNHTIFQNGLLLAVSPLTSEQADKLQFHRNPSVVVQQDYQVTLQQQSQVFGSHAWKNVDPSLSGGKRVINSSGLSTNEKKRYVRPLCSCCVPVDSCDRLLPTEHMP